MKYDYRYTQTITTRSYVSECSDMFRNVRSINLKNALQFNLSHQIACKILFATKTNLIHEKILRSKSQKFVSTKFFNQLKKSIERKPKAF